MGVTGQHLYPTHLCIILIENYHNDNQHSNRSRNVNVKNICTLSMSYFGFYDNMHFLPDGTICYIL